jgi:hypothetical protein
VGPPAAPMSVRLLVIDPAPLHHRVGEVSEAPAAVSPGKFWSAAAIATLPRLSARLRAGEQLCGGCKKPFWGKPRDRTCPRCRPPRPPR